MDQRVNREGTRHAERPGRLWPLVEERMAKPGAVESADRLWEARMFEQ